MFENSSVLSGGGDAVYGSQEGYQGYQSRGRGRARHEAQEERYVEGDLFGSSKRASFRSSDPPPGQPSRPAYFEGSGFNAFRNGGAGGGQPQAPAAQASPFARGPTHPNGFMMPPATWGAMGGGASAGPGRGYGQASAVGVGVGGVRGAGLEGGDTGGYGGEVALVPVDSNGSSRLMGDDDDDDMPTRSLADSHDVRDDMMGAGGLRQRRGGGHGRVAGAVNALPDEQRATWVVVWGVPAGKSDDVLTSFLQFGHIEEQRGAPDSNWLYFKYATRLQAEKALAAGHGSRLTETVMLGVQRVNEDEVWQALREGRIPPLGAGQPVLGREAVRGAAGRGRSSNAPRSGGGPPQVDDEDLLDAPPQRPRGDRGVCGKVMGFFGFY